jgi:bacillithiol biosynthesis cysteine-adding enzyme BshC
MHSRGIPFEDTGYFSSLIVDYLARKDDLAPFYGRFPTLEAFTGQLEDKQASFPLAHRKVLCEVLLEQYAPLEASGATLEHIRDLGKPGTFTVVTGHQLNLFTGPLYFVYKILSAVKLARQLKEAYPQYQFVPVYWMATEDHDFDEICHFNFRGKEIRWNRESEGGVGRLDLHGLDAVFDIFSAELGPGSRADTLRDLFRRAYLEHDTLAEATRHLANSLFGHLGLVILDADEPRLKGLFTPYVENDLFRHLGFETVGESITRLNALSEKYRIQVSPREINFFYLADGLRSRLATDRDGFRVVDTEIRFTAAEMKAELAQHPERFSPNVTTRPLYQEVILPNLCYIGGGGELAYWLELKAYFDASGVPFPILLLRNSALLIGGKQAKKLDKLGVGMEDLFLKPDALAAKKVREISKIPIDFSPQREHLKKQFEDLYLLARETDKSFLGAVRAQETKQLNGLDHLEKRLLKAQKRKLSEEVARVQALRDALFPSGSLQERSRNFSEFYLQWGPELFDILLEDFMPLRQEFSVFTL